MMSKDSKNKKKSFKKTIRKMENKASMEHQTQFYGLLLKGGAQTQGQKVMEGIVFWFFYYLSIYRTLDVLMSNILNILYT